MNLGRPTLRREFLLIGTVLIFGVAAWLGAADGAPEGARDTAAVQYFDQGMRRYAEGDLAAALAAFDQVEAMQISKEQRVSMYEAVQDINRRISSSADPATLIAQGDKAASVGQFSQAAGLYQAAMRHPNASDEQKSQAQAKLESARKKAQAQAARQQREADAKAKKMAEAEAKRIADGAAAATAKAAQKAPEPAQAPTESIAKQPVAPAKTADPPAKAEAQETAAVETDDTEGGETAADRGTGVEAGDLLTQARLLRAQEKLAEGRVAEQNRQYHLAVSHYKEALALDPGSELLIQALAAAEAKASQQVVAQSVLETEIQSRKLRANASVAEFEQLINRGVKLLEAKSYSAAREAVQQGKIALDLNQRFLPAAQYKTLRERAVNLAAQIAEAERIAVDAEIRRVESERKQEAEKRRAEAEKAQRDEVQRLLRRAADFRREQKYDQALELLDQALFLEPTNVAAQAMKEMIEDSRIFLEARDLFRQRNLLAAESSNENLHASLPFTDLVTYPADWPQLTSTRLASLELSSESEVNRQIAQKLRDTVPINFDGNKLVDVIDYLRNTTGVNFFVNWTALQNVGIEKDLPITLQLSNIPFEQALRLVLQQASAANELEPAGFSIIEGVVTISTERDLSRTTDVRTYDIRDLLVQVPSFTDAPEFDLRTALEFDEGEGGELFDGELSAEEQITRPELVAQITGLIRDTVGDSAEWAESGGDVSSIRELNGNLIIRSTPKNHTQVAQLLRELRETRALQIAIEARFLLVDQNFLDEVGMDFDVNLLSTQQTGNWTLSGPVLARDPITTAPIAWGPSLGQDSFGLTARPTTALTPDVFRSGARALDFAGTLSLLDDLEVNFMIRATQASRRSITLTAPRLTIFNGQRAYVIVARQIAFVSDLEPVPDAAGFDVTVSAIQSGVILDVEGTVSADRRYVTMTVRPSLANVIQPLRTITITGTVILADGADTTTVTGSVELPELELTAVKTTVSVPDRGTLLLGGQRLVNDIEIEAGVPVLSKVPVLNRFFTNKTTVKDERTLLVLIKPTIIVQTEEEEDRFPGLLQDPHKYSIGQNLSR